MNITNNNYTPTFNALYMPSYAKIETKLGKQMAEAAKNSKLRLEHFAKDYDVHVVPYKFNNENKGLAVKVEKQTKNPFKHFFTNLNIKYNTLKEHLGYQTSKSIYEIPLIGCGGRENSPECIADLLVLFAKELSNKIVKS